MQMFERLNQITQFSKCFVAVFLVNGFMKSINFFKNRQGLFPFIVADRG